MAKKKTKSDVFSIKTTKLQEMVSRAEKGASNNKLYPITQMLAIKLEDNTLTLITTDNTNYLYVKEDKVDGPDFYAVVPVDKFSKLISRMTCDTISMELKDTVLEVVGNGKYSIDLQFEDDGEIVQYPDPMSDFSGTNKTPVEVNKTTINMILSTVKPALATNLENPCYTGYHVGDKVVATDSFLINILDVDMLNVTRLVRPEVMDLLAVMNAEKIDVYFNEENAEIVFITPDCEIYGRDLEGIEDYAIDSILEYTEMEFPANCKLSRASLLSLIDRLSLFISDYDKGGVYLTFTKDGLQVSSMNTTGVELIPYIESEDFTDFACSIDVTMLAKQIKAQSGDVVHMYYGIEDAIKLVDGKVTQIIALLDDEREDEEDEDLDDEEE